MFLWLIVIALCVFADQLTKYIAVMFLRPVDTVPIIKDVLHLTYVENPGAAFGMLKDNRWIFMIISVVAIAAMLVYLVRRTSTSKLEGFAISLIVSGGIGNMIDRVFLEYVVDFVDFRLINFAVFNVADSFICIGAGLLILHVILLTVEESKAEKARKAALAADADGDENDDDTLQ
ncbi:MAG: signal peptidase II [Ruminococcaceae bacterium]|nr:signal peptidase II [Oscillospiraceae bacterium]